MSVIRRTLVSLVALAVAGVPLSMSAPASAAPVATAVPCATDVAARTGPGGKAPEWRQNADTGGVTQQDLDALPVEETRRAYVQREVEPRLPATVAIPVYLHVIRGSHKRERPGIARGRANNMIAILNYAMAGKQSSLSAVTRYRFTLAKISYTRRDSWYHAYENGPRSQKMKRKLHRGNARSLNVYINGGGPKGEQSLGFSRFPWQYAANPKLDGVLVNVAAIPGGSARGYNLGDTLVHETGHWLGLFHTFQGGCEGSGDYVTDTEAEGEPSFYCDTTSDTCPAPGLDPVHNFMDYSLDACMNMFTSGQATRIDAAFEKWRS